MTVRMARTPLNLGPTLATGRRADVLSCLAGVPAGTLGAAPTRSIVPERRHPAMPERVHGFDVTGREIADPVATVWTAAQMLELPGKADAAMHLMTAVEQVVLTPGVGGAATTQQVTDAIRGGNIP